MQHYTVTLAFACCLAASGAWAPLRAAGLPGDAEAASHGDEAATLQLVAETEIVEPDFVFRQYNLGVLSHYSYLVASGGEILIVDPARDIQPYLDDAAKLNARITRVYLTHSHADFVAGHAELAKATGAKIYINKDTGAGFPHEPIADGGVIAFGRVKAVVMTTPGHTPDGTCLLLHTPADSPRPRLMFTGDTLFIGSVGRPDLMGGSISAASLAALGFQSWTGKLSKLPDELPFYPAHGAGSLCGAHLSDKPVSTLGEQKRENVYLQHKDLHAYVTAVISGLPQAPQYFKHNAKLNHDGPPMLDWAALPSALAPAVAASNAAAGAWLLDVRDAAEFAAGHPAGAINIGVRGRFETWTGIMIPWGEPFILIGSDAEMREAAFRLHRIGYDAPAGSLKGGVAAWQQAGLPVRSVKLLQPVELFKLMQAGQAPVLVDVRLPAEWMGLRISENMLNLPINELARESFRLDPAMPVMTVCNSAYRSSMGASVLQKVGFSAAMNLAGGSEAWIEAGLPTYGADAHGTAGTASIPGVYVNLPEAISPADLARRLMDLPGTLEVVDVRPAPQFAEFSIPGSRQAPVAQVMSDAAWLSDRRPLVIVCRDGSVSAAVAGALAQKGARPIRFLLGGVARYYDEIMRPAGIAAEAVPLTPASAPRLAPAPASAPTPTAPTAPTPVAPQARKRSAGC
ncbi:MAG: rhodanese-like domain-containing protein [Kiritimatiellae bacterium]|nr:rhodanese-like domain-containing protein [Kiritimatiellia bacterium]